MNRCKEAERFDSALRWIVKKLRLWLDAADERVHAWEILLRRDSEMPLVGTKSTVREFSQARAVLPVIDSRRIKRRQESRVGRTKRPASPIRRRGLTAREFDLRFSGT